MWKKNIDKNMLQKCVFNIMLKKLHIYPEGGCCIFFVNVNLCVEIFYAFEKLQKPWTFFSDILDQFGYIYEVMIMYM